VILILWTLAGVSVCFSFSAPLATELVSLFPGPESERGIYRSSYFQARRWLKVSN
jgi:hypothetical protein